MTRYEVGRGAPVVLIHGLGDDHRAWRRVVAPLMLTRRVVLYDLRGHSASELGDADGSLAQLGSDLVGVLDGARIERAVIAGFSLGGTIAMRAAIDAPERVSGLALIGTSSRVNKAARAWYEERAALVDNDDPQLRATLDTDTEDVYRNRPEEIEAGLRIRRESTADPRGFANACRAMASLNEHPLDPELGAIGAPTVLVAGDADQHCPPRASEIIAEGIAGSVLTVIEDTGHPLPIERPHEVAEAILRLRDGISISIGISPREPLADWARYARELEQRGVGELWLIDSQLAMKDAYVGLALAATQTEAMRLGTGVSNLITRHPTVTANAIAAIAELSEGRCAAAPRGRRLRRLRPRREAVEGRRRAGGARVLQRRARRPRGHVAGPRLHARPGRPAHARLPRGQPAAHVPARRPALRRRDRHGPRAARSAHPPARLDQRGRRGRRARALRCADLLHRHALGARGP
jgi:pimeloyl-ACP methyl ester carboxylesterase